MRTILAVGLAVATIVAAVPSRAQDGFSLDRLLGGPPMTPALGDASRDGRIYPYGRRASRGHTDPLAGLLGGESSRSAATFEEPWTAVGGVRTRAGGAGSLVTDLFGASGGGARVIGGQNVAPGERPWQIQLMIGRGGLCGGSLIDPRWVLTAAHCVVDSGRVAAPDTLTVYHGDTRINRGSETRVAAVFAHNDYRQGYDQSRRVGFPHDIALLRLASPIDGPRIDLMTPAEERSLEQTGGVIQSATLSGWGRVANEGPIAETLQRVDLDVFHIETCARDFWPDGVWDRQICSGTRSGERGGCMGDSGGPLTARTPDGRTVQIGVVSWGSRRCEDPNRTGVFTRVASYRSWISDTIAQGGGSDGTGASSGSGTGQAPRVALAVDPGERVRLGSQVQFRVASERAGHLVLISLNARGEPTLLYPNPYGSGLIQAGGAVRVPDPASGFRFVAEEPAGPGLLFAVVSDRKPDAQRTLSLAGTMARGFVAKSSGSGVGMGAGSGGDSPLVQAGKALIADLKRVLGPYGQAWSAALLEYEITR